MTREEAIYELKNAAWLGTDHSRARTEEAVEMAIQALKQQKVKEIQGIMEGGWIVNFEMPEQEPCRYWQNGKCNGNTEVCEDVISREAVLEKQYRIDDSATLSTRDVVNVEDIEDEPPVTQKAGKWIEKEGWDGDVYYECSICGEPFCLIEGTPTDNMYNFCPNCGAKMVEPQERSDKE